MTRVLKKTIYVSESGGLASADEGPVPPGELWLLKHIALRGDSTGSPILRLLLREPMSEDWPLDYSTTPNDDSGDFNDTPIAGRHSLIFNWTGLSAGAKMRALVLGMIEYLE